MLVRRRGLPLAGILMHCLLVAPAIAQQAEPPPELARWHAQLTRPGEVVSLADANAAQKAIAGWKLDVTQLAPDALYQLMRLKIHAALALGDANLAEELQPDLVRLKPESPETLWTNWLVASAAGDALAAQQAMQEMLTRKFASESAATRRQSRLQRVGERIAEGELKAADQSIPLLARDGKVLVLAWSGGTMPQRDDKSLPTLRALYASVREDTAVQFVGVGSAESAVAGGNSESGPPPGNPWPQASAPSSLRRDDFGTDVQVVVVDQYGFVRAAGTATDAEVIYALRAAANEARGPARPILPRTLAGVRAQPPEAPKSAPQKPDGDTARAGKSAGPVAKPANPAGPEVKPAGDLPRNPEAQRLLDQARVYLKTGRKTDARKLLEEIIEKYPGTWEAGEAQLRLDAL